MLLNCITMRARVCCSNVWLYTPHNILFTLCEIWFGPFEEPHVKFWPFTLKIFSQPLDKIKLFFKQRKIIKIKFRSIWSILKAFTASRNLDIYKNNGLFRKAPLEGSDSNLWKGFTWLLLLFFSYVFKAPDLCFDMVLPRIYNYNLINI